MMSGEYEHEEMATRRKDPNYEQVSGFIPKELALKFRIICMTTRLTQSEALEQALQVWMNDKEVPSPLPPPPAPDPPQPRGKRGKG